MLILQSILMPLDLEMAMCSGSVEGTLTGSVLID